MTGTAIKLGWAAALSASLASLVAVAQPGPVATGGSLEVGDVADTTLQLDRLPAAAAASSAVRGRERRIKWFHFEERPRNPNPLPEHWFPIGRPAKTSNPNFDRYGLHQQMAEQSRYPHYGDVRFDTRHATSGQHSFYLGLNGGNVGAFLEVGALGAVQNSDYQVTARVRTTSLARAGARLVAYFVDGRGDLVAGSAAASPLTQTDGIWQTVSVKLLGDFNDVAWIGITIEVLQPTFDPDSPLGEKQLLLEETEGGAWFDDIVIWQLPRLVVRSQSDVNIVRPPHQPQLSMQVLDLTGRPLVAQVDVYDFQGRLVTRTRQHVGAGAPSRWQWTPRLDAFGWYLVDMQVFETNQPVGDGSDAAVSAAQEPVARTVSALLWLPEEAPMYPVDATRFGIVAEELPDDQLRLLGPLLDAARLDAAVLSAWERGTDLSHLDRRMNLLDEVLHQVLSRRRSVTLSLNPLPEELARTLDIRGSSPLDLFAKPTDQWRSYLAPLLMRQAQRVHHWQIGPVHSDDAFYYADLAGLIAGVDAQMRSMAPEPVLVLPWSIHQGHRTDLATPVEYALYVPYGLTPAGLRGAIAPWLAASAGDAGPSLAPAAVLTLEAPPATRLGHTGRVNDLVLKMIEAWQQQVHGLQVVRPWTVSTDRDRKLLPDPLLGAFTGVAHRLAGRRVLGALPMPRGLRGLILDGPAGGMLVMWNESAEPDDAAVTMFLGQNPVAIDVWGNREPVPQIDGQHHLGIGATPVFVEGIDPRLALFRAGFRIDPPFIESRQVNHERTLTLTNPWPRTISGTMTILEPADWSIQPKVHHFSIAAGQSTSVVVGMRFPPAEVAGFKQLKARLDFTAERRYIVDVTTDIELGLRDIQFDANLSLETDPETGRVDALVTALVTNKGAEVISLRSFAMMPDQPRQMQPIPSLKPGQSVVRRFRFAGVDPNDPNADVRLRLSELSGPAVLNQVLSLRGP